MPLTAPLPREEENVQGAFLLAGPTNAWAVRSGAIDLFLVRVDNGREAGARTPVARAEAGGAVFGMTESPSGYQLLANPIPDAEIQRIDASLATADDIRTWIDQMTRACVPAPPPSGSLLAPGEKVSLARGTPVFAAHGLTWATHLAGRSSWLGIDNCEPLEPAEPPFPLTGESFLITSEDSTIQAVSPPPLETQWHALEQFQRRVLAALEHRVRESEKRRIEQVRTRAGADGALARIAQRKLARALDDHAAQPTFTRAAGERDALTAAAIAVGHAQQLTIQADAASATAKNAIERIARASGIRVRRASLGAQWWKRDSGPLVGYLAAGGQAVALLPPKPGAYEMWDPVADTRRPVDTALAAQLAPNAHCFYRSFPEQKVGLKELLAFGLKGLRRDLVAVAGAGILAGLLGLLVPIATGTLVDEVIPSADRRQLWQVFYLLIVASVTTWLLQLLRSLAVLRIESKMDAGLQSAFWDRLLRLPVAFHRQYTAGDLATRSLGISAMRQMLTGTTLSAILTGIFSMFGLGLMFYYSAALSLPALGLVVLSFAVTVGSATFQIRVQRQLTEQSGRLSGMLPQLLNGISKLRVACAEDRAFARWAVEFAEQKKLSARGRRVSTALNIFFGLFQTATTMALFAALIYVTSDSGTLSTGAFLAFQSAFLQVLGGASQLGGALIGVLTVVPLYERAKPILEAAPEVKAGMSDPGELTGDLELNQVSFRYKADMPPVLTDVSMRVRSGQFAAIVGTTGSGKSTMLRLLLGFETPESGSIFYDGQDLSGLDLEAVRRQIGVVLQQGGVLGGDIFSNIVGSAPLSMDDAWEAARQAGLDEDIRQMPMGMHTVLPDGGLGLSGGQRQRLQIARAVVNRPRLIYFDEATSALDNQTQAVVMESLKRLKATRLVIAHRLSTIRDADCIFVLNHGVIEESGTYEELMTRGGLFESMARRQLA